MKSISYVAVSATTAFVVVAEIFEGALIAQNAARAEELLRSLESVLSQKEIYTAHQLALSVKHAESARAAASVAQ